MFVQVSWEIEFNESILYAYLEKGLEKGNQGSLCLSIQVFCETDLVQSVELYLKDGLEKAIHLLQSKASAHSFRSSRRQNIWEVELYKSVEWYSEDDLKW